MNIPEMTTTPEVVKTDKDYIVIRNYVDGIKGGKTLDCEGFTENVIKAGHVVIRSTSEENHYKPMPVSNGAYAALPEGYEYVGVTVATKLASQPFVGIMTSGEVNDKAVPFSVDTIKAALKTAVPTLIFNHD